MQSPKKTITLCEAQYESDYNAAKALIQNYAASLGMDLEFQEHSYEIAHLPVIYGPPRGMMLLAKEGEKYVGCAGLRPLDDRYAELKRMYVEGSHRGLGIGKKLTSAIIDRARSLGYRGIRLDTLPELQIASALYKKFGFKEIEAYRYNPRDDAIFMQLEW